jgi:tRNA (mo5U34)-methyltransferase
MHEFYLAGGHQMNPFTDFYVTIAKHPDLQHWLSHIPTQIDLWQTHKCHKFYARWQKVLAKLSPITGAELQLDDGFYLQGDAPLIPQEQAKITNLLQTFKPWRKGPFYLHGIEIETEWRSDWKWQRLIPHIQPLAGKTVLDVGCGNGYHLWRMLGAGATTVIGIDPSTLFLCQFRAIKTLAKPNAPVFLLPLGIEDLPPHAAFDTVFSMGVLYHRCSPIDHILQLKAQLKIGGQLILETMVIEGDEQTVLTPIDRYGKMNNVWFLPSVKTLQVWLKKCGFTGIEVINVNTTSIEEQRRTDWMTSESLTDYLSPDQQLTVEGHPAPIRATITAIKG